MRHWLLLVVGMSAAVAFVTSEGAHLGARAAEALGEEAALVAAPVDDPQLTLVPIGPPSPSRSDPLAGPPADTFAWVLTETRTNDWQARLALNNAGTARTGWQVEITLGERRVTMTNTMTVTPRIAGWVSKGMFESGTAAWEAPKAKIQSGETVSVYISAVNGPRSPHKNFRGIISISVQLRPMKATGDGLPPAGIAYFSGEKGLQVLGYDNRSAAPLEKVKAMVSRQVTAGAGPGARMSICTVVQGVGQVVETHYIYTWTKA